MLAQRTNTRRPSLSLSLELTGFDSATSPVCSPLLGFAESPSCWGEAAAAAAPAAFSFDGCGAQKVATPEAAPEHRTALSPPIAGPWAITAGGVWELGAVADDDDDGVGSAVESDTDGGGEGEGGEEGDGVISDFDDYRDDTEDIHLRGFGTFSPLAPRLSASSLAEHGAHRDGDTPPPYEGADYVVVVPIPSPAAGSPPGCRGVTASAAAGGFTVSAAAGGLMALPLEQHGTGGRAKYGPPGLSLLDEIFADDLDDLDNLDNVSEQDDLFQHKYNILHPYED